MINSEIIQTKGEVQMLKRQWWEIYKKGWYKHKDHWCRRWWIRFVWTNEANVS
jgi:hypothetical protein